MYHYYGLLEELPKQVIPALSELPFRDPLTYPAGYAAGFDASHPASEQIRFSGIAAANGGFTNLLTGKPGSVSGTSSAMTGSTGPAMEVAGSGGATWPGASTSTPLLTATMGGIFQLDNTSATSLGKVILATTSSGGGLNLCAVDGYSSNEPSINVYGFVAPTIPGVTLSANVPYFMVISMSIGGGTAQWTWVLVDLQSGQIISNGSANTGVSGSGSPGNGNYAVGLGAESNAFGGKISAVMYSQTYLSAPQLLQWAKDPWAFWYPDSTSDRLNLFAPGLPTYKAQLPALSELPFYRDPLVFPAGIAPGFDPTHPASSGMSPGKGLSAVSVGGNLISLLSAKAGTISGSPSATLNGILGRATQFTGTAQISFAGNSTAAQSSITLAGICVFNSVGTGYQSIIDTAPAGNSNLLGTLSTAKIGYFNGTDYTSGFTPVAGIPYFIAVSVFGLKAYFAITNLNNGEIFTSSITSTATTAPEASIDVGDSGASFPLTGSLAAVMYSPTALSLAQLLAWAQDPWSFWYPDAARERGPQNLLFPGTPPSYTASMMSGPTTATGSSAGSGSASAIGESDAVAVGSSSGSGSAVGVSPAAVGSASGSASVTGIGESNAVAVGSAVGSATATATGADSDAGAGSSSGSASVTGIGKSNAVATGSASGAATVAGYNASDGTGSGSVSGTASVAGIGESNAVAIGSASGSASVSGASGLTYAGSSSGSGAANAVGESNAVAVGSTSGAGAASTVGKSNAVATGSSSGSGSATATGESNAVAVGSASGSGSASAGSGATYHGSASGSGSAQAVGEYDFTSSGSSSGSAAVAATGESNALGVGSATGAGNTNDSGFADSEGAGSSQGQGAASAVGQPWAAGQGSASGSATVSGAGSEGGTVAAGSASGAATVAASGSANSTGQGFSLGYCGVGTIGSAVSEAIAAAIGEAIVLAYSPVRFTTRTSGVQVRRVMTSQVSVSQSEESSNIKA